MNQRKLNISRWYSLGLAAMLVIACLVMAVGVTWARYRTEADAEIYFEARKPVSVYLGRIEYSIDPAAEDSTSEEALIGQFTQTDAGNWMMNENNELQLEFAIANGTAEDDFEDRTQQVYIRLIGSLSAWSGDETAAITLVVPPEELEESEEETESTEEAEPIQIKATVTRIETGSSLYTTFGDGWVFRFLDDEGEELAWTLEGGQLDCIDMDLTMTDGAVTDISLLQLQIVNRYVKD